MLNVELKPVPVIVTDAPVNALAGVKEFNARMPSKLFMLVAVMPLTVTVIFPTVLPAGRVAVTEVAVLAVTVAAMPLNFTILLAAVELKPVPEIVTAEPAMPTPGVNEVIANGKTKNSVGTVTVEPPRVTVTYPVVAPVGTVTVRLVALPVVIVQVVPFILTIF